MSDSAEDLQSITDRIVRVYVSVSPGKRPPEPNGKGSLDSMALIEFISRLEREFDIAVVMKEVNEANFATTSATAAFVQKKLRAKVK